MICKTVKTMIMAFVLLGGLALSLTAEAVKVTGTLANTTRPSLAAVDSWRLTCPVGTAQVLAQITDNNNFPNTAALVYVSLGKEAISTSFTFDNEGGGSSSPITKTTTPTIATTFAVVVSKSALNAEDYTVEVRCLNSSLADLTASFVQQINE